jgi:crossover junction endodeoxyribonuclease RuvC
MRVLGIDPALAGPTGYGLVETEGPRCRALHFGEWRAAGRRNASRAKSNGHAAPALKDTPAERLSEIHDRVARLLDEHRPDAVALEGVFAALNVKTALKLAEVRGVVLLAAAQRGLPVHTYSPREVKLSVTGYGHADKQQMQQMVRAQLLLSEAQQSQDLGTDAADALAVALCHIHSMQARARIAHATAPVGQTSRPAQSRGQRGEGSPQPAPPMRSPGADTLRPAAINRARALRIQLSR